MVRHPEWTDLSGKHFVLLGATSAMGPFLLLKELGANIIAVDIDRPAVPTLPCTYFDRPAVPTLPCTYIARPAVPNYPHTRMFIDKFGLRRVSTPCRIAAAPRRVASARARARPGARAGTCAIACARAS